jgi:hypothetical protein
MTINNLNSFISYGGIALVGQTSAGETSAGGTNFGTIFCYIREKLRQKNEKKLSIKGDKLRQGPHGQVFALWGPG